MMFLRRDLFGIEYLPDVITGIEALLLVPLVYFRFVIVPVVL
jgi:hypothetical protein